MKLTRESNDGSVVRMKVTGRIRDDDESVLSEPLGELLNRKARSQAVLLDMSDVDFLNSPGISWLLNCNKKIREAGGQFVLHGAPPMVANVFKLMRLQLVFKLASDESQALQLLEENRA